jgi:predicted nucleic acid-binding protein
LRVSALLLKRGKPLPAIDILIAAICLRRGLTLMTGDEHFRHIKSVKKEFKIELAK